jgi:hypothetical protein
MWEVRPLKRCISGRWGEGSECRNPRKGAPPSACPDFDSEQRVTAPHREMLSRRAKGLDSGRGRFARPQRTDVLLDSRCTHRGSVEAILVCVWRCDLTSLRSESSLVHLGPKQAWPGPAPIARGEGLRSTDLIRSGTIRTCRGRERERLVVQGRVSGSTSVRGASYRPQ